MVPRVYVLLLHPEDKKRILAAGLEPTTPR